MSMPVPFFDYKGVFAEYRPALHGVLDDILDRGAFILQQDVRDFESALAAFCGTKHAIGVANCTDGLMIQLEAAGLQSGDEVLVSSHTFIATAAAVVRAGGVPVPVDIDEDGLFDAKAARSSITVRTKWVMPTQLNGRVSDMDAIQSLVDDCGLGLVEDAAQALGATYHGRQAGTFGRASSFSFYPAKLLGALGDAGAIITDDDDLAEQMRLLRDHGRSSTGEVVRWSHNSRLDNLQAAFLNLFLADLPKAIERRRAIASHYHARLAGCPSLALPPRPGADPARVDVFQNLEIRAQRRDELKAFLADRQIGSLIQWSGWPVHHNRQLGFDVLLPNTDRYFDECLLLPLHIALTDAGVDRVCDVVLEFYAR